MSDVSDLEGENSSNTLDSSDSEIIEDDSDGGSHVSFAPESTISEYPIEPNKYDEGVDMEEEKKILQKVKGIE